jgi:hypothetical protein
VGTYFCVNPFLTVYSYMVNNFLLNNHYIFVVQLLYHSVLKQDCRQLNVYRICIDINICANNSKNKPNEANLKRNQLCVNAFLNNFYFSPGSRGEHTWWAAKFYFCEVLNFINVLVQVSFHVLFSLIA